MSTKKNVQAEAETTQPEVTQPETTQPEVPKVPEKMDIYIERGSSNDDPNLQVCVNGVMYLLPKGKTSTVPLAVYNEIMRSRRAREQQDQRMNELRDAAQS